MRETGLYDLRFFSSKAAFSRIKPYAFPGISIAYHVIQEQSSGPRIWLPTLNIWGQFNMASIRKQRYRLQRKASEETRTGHDFSLATRMTGSSSSRTH